MSDVSDVPGDPRPIAGNASGATDDTESDTRLRLLNAAGETFAELGFRAATVRDICRRADANIAAVSYHFGSKQQLYRQTLLHWVELAASEFPLEPPDDRPPRERLRWFIHAMINRVIGHGKPAWHGRLMAREMLEPTSYTDEHIRSYVDPALRALDAILRDLAGPTLSDRPTLRRRITHTVMSHIMFYFHTREVLPRIHPEFALTSEELARTSQYIATATEAVLATPERYDFLSKPALPSGKAE